MKHIYLSPHADDVALSCGGRILMDPGHRTDSLVLTVFTSQRSYTDHPRRRQSARFADAISPERDGEDQSAWRSIGVEWRNLGLPEALLRGSFPFKRRRSAQDRDVEDQLYERVVELASSYPEATFYFPAGVGGHIDHLICRDVACRLLHEAVTSPVLYEDAPYWWLKPLRSRFYEGVRTKLLSNEQEGPAHSNGLGLIQYLFR